MVFLSTAAVAKSLVVVGQSDAAVPKSLVVVAQSDAVVPKSDVSVAKSLVAVVQSDVSVGKSDVSVAKSLAVVAKSDVAVGQSDAGVAKSLVDVARSDAVQKCLGSIVRNLTAGASSCGTFVLRTGAGVFWFGGASRPQAADGTPSQQRLCRVTLPLGSAGSPSR